MKSNIWAAAALIGVFALGAIAGAGGAHAYMLKQFSSPFDGPPREVRAHLRIESMRRQLDLSPNQITKIKTILDDTNDEIENAIKPCREEMETLRKRTDERIIETLDPAQTIKFREFSGKMHKRRARGPFPHPHPSGFLPPPPH